MIKIISREDSIDDKIIKDDKIVVRINTELKEKFIKLLDTKGTNASDYLRQYIVETVNNINKYKFEDSTKSYIMETTQPEIELYKRLSELEAKVKAMENILKNQGIVKY